MLIETRFVSGRGLLDRPDSGVASRMRDDNRSSGVPLGGGTRPIIGLLCWVWWILCSRLLDVQEAGMKGVFL